VKSFLIKVRDVTILMDLGVAWDQLAQFPPLKNTFSRANQSSSGPSVDDEDEADLENIFAPSSQKWDHGFLPSTSDCDAVELLYHLPILDALSGDECQKIDVLLLTSPDSVVALPWLLSYAPWKGRIFCTEGILEMGRLKAEEFCHLSSNHPGQFLPILSPYTLHPAYTIRDCAQALLRCEAVSLGEVIDNVVGGLSFTPIASGASLGSCAWLMRLGSLQVSLCGRASVLEGRNVPMLAPSTLVTPLTHLLLLATDVNHATEGILSQDGSHLKCVGSDHPSAGVPALPLPIVSSNAGSASGPPLLFAHLQAALKDSALVLFPAGGLSLDLLDILAAFLLSPAATACPQPLHLQIISPMAPQFLTTVERLVEFASAAGLERCLGGGDLYPALATCLRLERIHFARDLGEARFDVSGRGGPVLVAAADIHLRSGPALQILQQGLSDPARKHPLYLLLTDPTLFPHANAMLQPFAAPICQGALKICLAELNPGLSGRAALSVVSHLRGGTALISSDMARFMEQEQYPLETKQYHAQVWRERLQIMVDIAEVREEVQLAGKAAAALRMASVPQHSHKRARIITSSFSSSSAASWSIVAVAPFRGRATVQDGHWRLDAEVPESEAGKEEAPEEMDGNGGNIPINTHTPLSKGAGEDATPPMLFGQVSLPSLLECLEESGALETRVHPGLDSLHYNIVVEWSDGLAGVVTVTPTFTTLRIDDPTRRHWISEQLRRQISSN
jgi:hypothetical protein